MKKILPQQSGKIYFEYSIPRMGKRIDVLLVIGNVIFILEFKVGEREFGSHAIDQVWDYALDLKNFHESSHHAFIAPILIATKARSREINLFQTLQNDDVLYPILSNLETLPLAIDLCKQYSDKETIDLAKWEDGR